jgi:hypothetical protein
LREAIRVKKDHAESHYNLGLALSAKGAVDEAVAEYREAIRLKKDCAQAHCNLGHVLFDKGQFAEALNCFRRGHELGSKDPRWPYPSAQWVKDCERVVELEGKLPAILSGKQQPASATERAYCATVCHKKHLYAAAVRFYTEVFAEGRRFVGEQPSGPRYNAACAAALAGCGQGTDAGNLPDKDYVRLRTQSFKWLRDDLAAWRTILEKHGDKARPAVVQQMRHWLDDSDFNGVRGPDALARLPDSEREGWQKLWAEVAATLAGAQAKGAPAQPGGGPEKTPK